MELIVELRLYQRLQTLAQEMFSPLNECKSQSNSRETIPKAYPCPASYLKRVLVLHS